jgi:hypothetical protein
MMLGITEIDDIVEVGLKIIDRVIPNPADKEKAKLELLKLQQEGQLKLEEFSVKRQEIEQKDRESARQREVGTKDGVNRTLAYIIVVAFLGVIIATLAGWSKADSVLAGTLIGYLSAKAEQVLSYYFGSTHSSAEKNSIIATMSKK